jgi:penicillin amidase
MLPPDQEPRLQTRHNLQPTDSPISAAAPAPPAPKRRRRTLLWLTPVALAAVAVGGALAAHVYLQHATRDSLPQLDGTAQVSGLAASVTVQRDAQGMPHIHAQSLDDLVFAQAWVTAHDRLWQMDLLRRHAAGELAAVLGPRLLEHDRLQRTLQIRAAADRALATLPADELHLLTVYAAGVNASLADQRSHLPVEFRVLRYTPAAWTPRDSLLVALVLFEDLSNTYPQKLEREALAARLTPELAADLFPVGSWRDHPPTQPPVDLTIEGPAIEQIPLDESQEGPFASVTPPTPSPILRSIEAQVAALTSPVCPDCIPGSNNWVVAGSRTASGKPLLANDMHLAHSVPGIWYEADLSAPIPGSDPFHVTGVTLPGLPLVIVGHNAHVAWGFTNLGADVEDVYIEQTRNNGTEFQSADGSWQPILHLPETIAVKNRPSETLDVLATKHGDTVTPILTPRLKSETRTLALRWTAYDPSVLRIPFFQIDSARDWTSFTAAMSQFGGPTQNAVYADDQGHIGYHAIGRVPLRGQALPGVPAEIASPNVNPDTQTSPTIAAAQSPLSTTEIATRTPTAQLRSGALSSVPIATDASHEWSGYIPFAQLPQTFDPAGGLIATANSRVTPDDYPYPITLNWGAPYRNERIWKLLQGRHNLTPADMLAVQNDLYSDLDHVVAQRIAYAVDHSTAVAQSKSPENQAALRKAADILRTWNGNVETTSVAANIVTATRAALWPMLLDAHAAKKPGAPTPTELYNWFERDYALEQLLMHTPQRWLPQGIANWDDLLATALDKGLADAHAPGNAKDLANWTYGRNHVVDVEHPIFGQSKLLSRLLGMRTGTGSHPQSGDGTTVKQVGKAFGPSERFTADFGDLDKSTLNIVLGESGNPASPNFLDQFQAWYRGTTYPLPFTDTAVSAATTHTLTLTP